MPSSSLANAASALPEVRVCGLDAMELKKENGTMRQKLKKKSLEANRGFSLFWAGADEPPLFEAPTLVELGEAG